MSARRSVERMMAAIEREKKINFQRNLSCSTVEVYLPKFYFWVALVCSSVNLSVGILGLFLTRDVMGYIAAGYFGLWALVCGFLLCLLYILYVFFGEKSIKLFCPFLN